MNEKEKLKVRVGRIDAANGSFTGVQIELPDGHTVTMQLRPNEGWITSSYEGLELEEIGDVGAFPQGVGHRFDILS